MTDVETDYSVTGESAADSHTTKDTGQHSRGSEETTGKSVISVVTINPAAPQANHSVRTLPELPTKKFQFSVWHDLRTSEVTGPELKAPRVRDGPKQKEKEFYKLMDEENAPIHHSLHGKERKQHRDKLEKWEDAEFVSLTHQELDHGFQRKNFERILGRLKKVVHLNLMYNITINLSSFTFPQCEYLNMNNNYLPSMKNLPRVPRVRYLMLMDNDVSSLEGLKQLRSTPISELYLIGNPVTFLPGYRQRVFEILPTLEVLDGIPKLESDTQPPPDDVPAIPDSSCLIS